MIRPSLTLYGFRVRSRSTRPANANSGVYGWPLSVLEIMHTNSKGYRCFFRGHLTDVEWSLPSDGIPIAFVISLVSNILVAIVAMFIFKGLLRRREGRRS
jgi:hypothetical protein